MSKYSQKKQIRYSQNSNTYAKVRNYNTVNADWKEYEEKKSVQRKNQDLLKYAELGNKKMVKVALELGQSADINTVDENGNNALIIAARFGNFDVVKYLVEKGIDINCEGDIGTALHIYAKKNMIREVRWLIKNGADVNSVGIYDQTPIYEAILNNDEEMLIELVNSGAKFDWYNREGYTPLIVASQNRNRQNLVARLIKMGADTYAQDRDGNTALLHAIRAGNRPGFLNLVNYSDINHTNKKNQSALIMAAKRGDREVVRTLLKLGVDEEHKDIYGHDAIYYARKYSHPSCAEIIAKSIRLKEEETQTL